MILCAISEFHESGLFRFRLPPRLSWYLVRFYVRYISYIFFVLIYRLDPFSHTLRCKRTNFTLVFKLLESRSPGWHRNVEINKSNWGNFLPHWFYPGIRKYVEKKESKNNTNLLVRPVSVLSAATTRVCDVNTPYDIFWHPIDSWSIRESDIDSWNSM